MPRLMKWTVRYLSIVMIISCLTGCDNINSKNKHPSNLPMAMHKEKQSATELFWQIIDTAFQAGQFNNDLKSELILDQLKELTPQQIIDFEITLREKMEEANTWENFAAQTIIEGGSSDDRFVYFRCWLISIGKKNFYETLKNQDYLAGIDIPINKKYHYGEVHFEELIYVSTKAYIFVTKNNNEDESFPRGIADKKGLNY